MLVSPPSDRALALCALRLSLRRPILHFALPLLFSVTSAGSPLFAGEAPPAAPASAQPLDAVALLARSDQARGGNLPGLAWTVLLTNTGKGSEHSQSMTVAVEAIPSSSIAIVQAPASNRGFVMLQVERKMWLTKPDLHKPVPISPRQRLSGQVAIGDIAATNYAKEYEPTFEKDEAIDGELCHVLMLKAKSREATYDNIRYWISQARLVAVRADFLALNGRHLKSARFEYGNRITGPRGEILFVSRMIIRDALTDASSVLEYRDIKVRPIPASRFRPENL
jgi:hypothetical protein